MRLRLPPISSKSVAKLTGALCLASLAAGCSSGITRFDHGLLPGNTQQQAAPLAPQTVAPVSSGPALAQPYPANLNGQRAPAPVVDNTYTNAIPANNAGYQRPVALTAPTSSQTAVSRASLRPASINETPVDNIALAPLPGAGTPTPASAPRRSYQTASHSPSDPMVTGAIPSAAPRNASSNRRGGWTTTGGTRVTVGSGETLYNLSRRYGVPAKEIMKANNISDPSRIGAGQVLIIPTYVYSRTASVSAPDNNPRTRAARASIGNQSEINGQQVPVPAPSPVRQVAVLPNAQPAASQNSHSAYTVQSGDTLSGIASRNGVSVAALQAANGLSSSSIGIGQTLRIPGAGSGPASVQSASTASTATRGSRPQQPKTTQQVVSSSINSGDTPKTTGIGKLRWPARGQVMTSFGDSDNGVRNDGIDISLPKGTPVKAAENGTVIYAGDGLKEFGNTVLVRHDNGLVSVYGHASELTVERGDTVSRGQVVALSGMSGQTNRPKLHFEIRKDAKPVNPISYLE
ncbi:MAG: LysM peptidoglycan-binding domain-containing protein [Pseudomonadota bacterium]